MYTITQRYEWINDFMGGECWTVLNSRGYVLINTDSLRRAVDFVLWHCKAHKRASVYGWRYVGQHRYYALNAQATV